MSTTNVQFPGMPLITNIPGTKTVEQVRASYAQDVQGINNMDASFVDSNGIRTITFTQKQGTKG